MVRSKHLMSDLSLDFISLTSLSKTGSAHYVMCRGITVHHDGAHRLWCEENQNFNSSSTLTSCVNQVSHTIVS